MEQERGCEEKNSKKTGEGTDWSPSPDSGDKNFVGSMFCGRRKQLQADVTNMEELHMQRLFSVTNTGINSSQDQFDSPMWTPGLPLHANILLEENSQSEPVPPVMPSTKNSTGTNDPQSHHQLFEDTSGFQFSSTPGVGQTLDGQPWHSRCEPPAVAETQTKVFQPDMTSLHASDILSVVDVPRSTGGAISVTNLCDTALPLDKRPQHTMRHFSEASIQCLKPTSVATVDHDLQNVFVGIEANRAVSEHVEVKFQHHDSDPLLLVHQPSIQLPGSFISSSECLERFGIVPEITPVQSHMERQLEWSPLEGFGARPCSQAFRVQGLGSLIGSRELNTMEQLLLHCASAMEANDVTYPQQIVWVMNNVASMEGDSNQKLLAYFLRSLILRASKITPHFILPTLQGPLRGSTKIATALELTNYVDVMPWYRFGYIAANGAILEAFEGKDKVHILDLNTSHCMQWPTLIEALSERSEGPPHVRLSVCIAKSPVPPQLEVDYQELIVRLAKFARMRNVPFEFQLFHQECEDLHPSMIDVREDEVLAVNCLLRLHYVSDENLNDESSCPRDKILRLIRTLNPKIITLTDEDVNLTSPNLVSRLKSAFNYLWIPFDALHTLLPQDSEQRAHFEGELASRIENIVACEGPQRIERMESKEKWVQRMKNEGFEMIPFTGDVATEITHMLSEHSGCWGLKKDDDEDVLFLTWKGHNVSFSTVWVPTEARSF
jgi:hypothetical protein